MPHIRQHWTYSQPPSTSGPTPTASVLGAVIMHYPPGGTLVGCPGLKPSGLPLPGLVPAPPQSCSLFSDYPQGSWRLYGSLRSRLQSLCCPRRSRWGHPLSGWNRSLPPSVALGCHTPGDWWDNEPASHTRPGEWWLMGDRCAWEWASSNCGQSCTTAWTAMHSPALSGFLWQNLDRPPVRLESCHCWVVGLDPDQHQLWSTASGVRSGPLQRAPRRQLLC